MGKHILLALIALLIPTSSPAWMVPMVSGGGAGMDGGACATQSYDVQVTAGAASYTVFETTQTGQSWLSGVTKDLYSISLEVSANASSDTITIRVDNDSDLSADYLVEFTCTVPASAGFFECVVPSESRPALSASTTYYFLWHTQAAHSWDPMVSFSTTYADGTRYNEESLDWNSAAASGDLNFKIRVCD